MMMTMIKLNYLLLFKLAKLLVFISLVYFIASLIFINYVQIDTLSLNDERLLQTHKCPYCFGITSLCDRIKQRNNNEDEFEIYSIGGFDCCHWLPVTYLLNRLLNLKNILFVRNRLDGRTMVCKKLAHDQELQDFDSDEARNCSTESAAARCTSLSSLGVSFFAKKFDKQTLLKLSSHLSSVSAFECLSERLIELLNENLIKNTKNNLLDQNLAIATTLKINPEPLILQMFRKVDGWPFPEYHGSCGRLICESHEGNVLSYYIDHPFRKRASIAKALLEAVVQLNQNEQNVSIYMFDMSYDNVAYNEQENRAYFIDLEDLLVVDQNSFGQQDSSSSASSLYEMPFEKCEGQRGDCLSYSPDKLCTHKTVDLNSYSVCRNILSEYATFANINRNFLHSIPAELDSQYNLNYLLNECSKLESNNSKSIGRAGLIKLLIKQLDNFLND